MYIGKNKNVLNMIFNHKCNRIIKVSIKHLLMIKKNQINLSKKRIKIFVPLENVALSVVNGHTLNYLGTIYNTLDSKYTITF